MGKKSKKEKDAVFITKEYFEKCGITRQVLNFRINKGDIKPFSQTKGINLYYQIDADFLILKYWAENHKKYLKLLEKAWKDNVLSKMERKPDTETSTRYFAEWIENKSYLDYLPSELYELSIIVERYLDLETGFPIDPENELHCKFSELYIEGIVNKTARFVVSMEDIDAFLEDERINKFMGRTHSQIYNGYLISKLANEKAFGKIDFFLYSLSPYVLDESQWILPGTNTVKMSTGGFLLSSPETKEEDYKYYKTIYKNLKKKYKVSNEK